MVDHVETFAFLVKGKVLKLFSPLSYTPKSHSQKKCDIYCNKHNGCINYAVPHKGLQQLPQKLNWELNKTKKYKKGWFHRC